MKQYYFCKVTTETGSTFNNPLKLSEVHIIGKLARENKSVSVTVETASKAEYKSLFG